ncbi:MAG: hypothetical protein IJS26_03745 [Alphaproteobacteria bacterium]|nr:hypothetical protein [Alphaproteobacteria bacterium]
MIGINHEIKICKSFRDYFKKGWFCERPKEKIVIYQREYELLKKAAFGDLKERMNAVKQLRQFTTEALRHEQGL